MLLPDRCPVCGHPGRPPCTACAWAVPPPPPEAPVPAAFAFAGPGRRLILALKYANARGVARAIAAEMVRHVPRGSVDVVTWAPTSASRRRDRGYDQAELLARAVARRLRLPCRRLLVRQAGGAQTGRSRTERLQGPSFSVRRRPQGRVLVVDDVVTTGATLAAAEQALRSAGARDVRCVAAAATPARLLVGRGR